MKSKRRKTKTFKELESDWYEKLKASGFEDIENTSHPQRPLKEWHSRKFLAERTRMRQAEREKYNRVLDYFINSASFGELCALIVKHGNCALWPEEVQKIIELHRYGLTERTIARTLKCGKKSVHLTLAKARQWMKLAS